MAPGLTPRRGRASLRGVAAFLIPLAVTGCRLDAGVIEGCLPTTEPAALPDLLRESSGAALSRFHPDLIWTHNDGGQGQRLYAVGVDGRLRADVLLDNAPNRDWEDMELAPCEEGSCLFIGDVGDNYGRWEEALVHRLPEPALTDSVARVTTRAARYPHGPRDAEALFVLPGERIHLITKGSDGPVEVYRFPDEATGTGAPGVLELVQVLDDGKRVLPRQVTGASASPSGDEVVVRTYETLEFYRVDGDTLALVADRTINLRPLGEAQGEAVGWGTGGRLVLTSERGPFGSAASLTMLHCSEDR
jgi:hypothetical protein